ncbi:hypothetical protein FRX31_009770 [Thalictrum thalictroides]|uniref:Uncharacterized protein n=1 Tax=Thalictrum thalictroides TaxID=46969 RepID=A0A7J6WUC5_THATH|nr:hypothetical protein FRX31_009770 [Thalictrum thalictroides]
MRTQISVGSSNSYDAQLSFETQNSRNPTVASMSQTALLQSTFNRGHGNGPNTFFQRGSGHSGRYSYNGNGNPRNHFNQGGNRFNRGGNGHRNRRGHGNSGTRTVYYQQNGVHGVAPYGQQLYCQLCAKSGHTTFNCDLFTSRHSVSDDEIPTSFASMQIFSSY